jgi:ketosteroid isomerase-like protein
METTTPSDVINQLVTAMNKCELESALTLFEPGASFVVKPGVVVSGISGIRQALEGFMALKPTLTIRSTTARTGRRCRAVLCPLEYPRN